MGEDDMKLNVLFLGRCEYEKALSIQYDILERRQNGDIGDTLIIVEHPPVITLGRHAIESNIIVSQKYLSDQGISLYNTNRGGDVTYHGDGQIVGYPIVNLREKGIGIKDFVHRMEEAFIDLLKDKFDIYAGKDEEHTGVWVEDEKILAIGLAVKKGVTMHGFAFNVNTNVDHFKLIVPCGISDKGVTTIEKIMGQTIDFNNTSRLTVEYLCKSFGYSGYEIVDINNIIGGGENDSEEKARMA